MITIHDLVWSGIILCLIAILILGGFLTKTLATSNMSDTKSITVFSSSIAGCVVLLLILEYIYEKIPFPKTKTKTRRIIKVHRKKIVPESTITSSEREKINENFRKLEERKFEFLPNK